MHFRKIFINIICCFIPGRRLRGKFRDFFMYCDTYYLKRLFSNKNSYDYIFSLGDACFTANALRLAKLRFSAGPFDWLCGANLETRIDLILNNFDNFINFDDFDSFPGNPGGYKNKRTGLIFLHDFEATDNFDEKFKSVRTKYLRRIERLLKCLASGRRILLIYVSANENIDGVKCAIKNVHKQFGNNIDFMFIKTNQNVRRCRIKKIGTNLFVGETLCWPEWKHWNRKKSTRMFINALSGIKLKHRD